MNALLRTIAAGLSLLLAAALPAQSTPTDAARLEAALPRRAGVERARALATLTAALESDQPARAVAYGHEALRLLDVYPDSAARARTLTELAWAYMTMSQYDSAIALADRGRRFAEATWQRGAEARALSNLGTIAQRRGDPDEAVALFARALEIQRTLGAPKDIANSLNNLGFVYSTDLADYDRALAHHVEALAIRERLGDSVAISLSLNNLGIVYDRLRQFDRALDYFGRALAIRRQLGLKPRIAATLDNIGSVYTEIGDHRRALATHRESLAIRGTIADPSAVAMAHRNVGMAYLALGQPARARDEIAAALRIGDAVGDRGLLVRNLIALAAIDRARGQPLAAERDAERALDVARAMGGARDLRLRAWEARSDAQAAAGHLADALASYRQVKAVGDSIFDAATARRIASLERRHEEERRGHELERLRRDQAIYRLQASRRTWQRNAAAALALLAAGVGVVAYRRRVARTRRAEALSLTDPLTGVKNRRFVQQVVDAETAIAQRRHRVAQTGGVPPDDADLVCLLLDLDHFKRVNDTYGHAVGDRLLVETARVLESASRRSDIVVRWGGEEFLILGRFADRRQAAAHAERLRHAVEAMALPVGGARPVRVTCSVGFAVFPFDPRRPGAVSWDDTVRLADHAVYSAKRDGRNRWVGFVAGAAPPPGAALPDTTADLARWIDAGWLERIVAETPALAAG